MTPQAGQRAKEALEELLQVADEHFVRLAYQTVLGRPADNRGEAHYLAELRKGRTRTDLLLELSRSSEGVRRMATSPALSEALGELAGAAGKKPVSNLAELLALPDIEFVHLVVQKVQRLPADDGLVLTLCGRLRAGLPRMELMRALTIGADRAAATGIAGLDERLTALAAGDTPAVAHASELIAMRGRWFVEAAYRAVLGRSPDARGALDNLALLARGVSTAGVVALMASSEEGRGMPRRLPGLEDLLRSYRRHNIPLLAWFWAWVPGSHSDAWPARWRRRHAESRRGFWAAEFAAAHAHSGQTESPPSAPASSSVALEAALLARQEAFASIQRDNFERELHVLRREKLTREQAGRRRTAGRSPLHRRP